MRSAFALIAHFLTLFFQSLQVAVALPFLLIKNFFAIS